MTEPLDEGRRASVSVPAGADDPPGHAKRGARIVRLSGGDLMQWQADVGPLPQHIAGLLHLGPTALTATELAAHLSGRLAGVGSLARYPAKPPLGGGSPVWLADNGKVSDHVRVESLSGRLDEAILARATALMSRQFRPGRAPWAAYVLADGNDAPIAVLVVLHHVLADGLAGVELLTALTRPRPSLETGASSATHTTELPVRMPAWMALARDAWAGRMRGLLRAPSVARSLGPAVRELGMGRGTLAPRSPLNRRTGPSRRHAAVDLPEGPVRAAARAAGGSLNDALLVVISEVLAEQAARLGQELDPVVVSVPVAVRQRVSGGRAESNAVGVRPTSVPTGGSLTERIAIVADWRHDRLRESGDRAGASLPLVLASFRVLHALRLVRWFTDRQRLVTTFATAIPGPTEQVILVDAPVTRITPLVLNQGNTTIAFASMTYAGLLTIGVVADPASGPDPLTVADLVRERLLQLAASPSSP